MAGGRVKSLIGGTIYSDEPTNQLPHDWYKVQVFDNEYRMTLLKPVRFEIVYKNKLSTTMTMNEHIPAGYSWDGASIPGLFQFAAGKPDEYPVESLAHDRLYEIRFDRQVADDVFYYLLDKAGVRDRLVRWMFGAVRIGGFVFYAGDTSKFWRFVRGFL